MAIIVTSTAGVIGIRFLTESVISTDPEKTLSPAAVADTADTVAASHLHFRAYALMIIVLGHFENIQS